MSEPPCEHVEVKERADERYRLAADGLALGVTLSFPGSPIHYPVGDISRAGLSFETEQPVPDEYLDKPVDANIHLGGRTVVLRIRPVNRSGTRVGCRIERFPPKWEREFAAFIDPLLLGARLLPVPSPPVSTDAYGNVLGWYRAPFACDLFVWTAPSGQIVVAQLLFRTHLVQWAAGEGLRTGLVRTPPRIDETLSPRSVQTYTTHHRLNRVSLAFAQRLLARAECVPAAVKALFASP